MVGENKMNSKEILAKIRELSNEEKRKNQLWEIKEETNLDIEEKDLELIDIVSGKIRRNSYLNGDVVINNTALYCIRHYTGELKWDEESNEMKFFDLNNLPKNQNDSNLIEIYKKYKRKQIEDSER